MPFLNHSRRQACYSARACCFGHVRFKYRRFAVGFETLFEKRSVILRDAAGRVKPKQPEFLEQPDGQFTGASRCLLFRHLVVASGRLSLSLRGLYGPVSRERILRRLVPLLPAAFFERRNENGVNLFV